MVCTPETKRWEVIVLHKRGQSIASIARDLSLKRSTVKNIIELWQRTASVKPRHGSGRPPKLSRRAAKKALELLTSHSCSGAGHAARTLFEQGYTTELVSRFTIGEAVKREARAQGHKLTIRRGKPKKQLSEFSKKKRLDFAQLYKDQDWGIVMFTDRKKFLFMYPGASVSPVRYVMLGAKDVAPLSAHAPCLNIYAALTQWGMSTAHVVAGTTGEVWDWHTKKHDLAHNITREEYCESVLPCTLLPEGNSIFRKHHVRSWVLQQDGDPTHHYAKAAIETFNETHHSHIKLLEGWPGNSPDLNPIENVWAIVQDRVNRMACKNFAEFKAAVFNTLASLTPKECSTLVHSMPKRLAKVISMKGGRTGF